MGRPAIGLVSAGDARELWHDDLDLPGSHGPWSCLGQLAPRAGERPAAATPYRPMIVPSSWGEKALPRGDAREGARKGGRGGAHHRTAPTAHHCAVHTPDLSAVPCTRPDRPDGDPSMNASSPSSRRSQSQPLAASCSQHSEHHHARMYSTGTTSIHPASIGKN
jgi:hypothetical protein